ncbi:restriction endonuclease subunit S [Leptothrix sp. BB-4]
MIDIAAKRANATVGGPFGSDLVAKDYVDSGVPVIRGQNMGQRFVSGEFAFVTSAKARALQANVAKPSDLVFTQRGTLGQVALVPAAPYEEYLISQSQMKLTVDFKVAAPGYIYQYFASALGQKQILNSAIQTGVPHTNLGILRSYAIPLPRRLAEQEAIASALTDADALIDSLEQLLTKKRQVKQGAMQELLTGRRRLLQGEAAWRRTPLGSLGKWSGGMTPSMARIDYWSPAQVPWLSSGDLKTTQLSESAKFVSKAAVRDGATTVVPAKSVVFVMRSGILRKYLPVGITLNPMAINQDLKAIQPTTEVAAEFLLHALAYWGERILATCLKAGTTVESLEPRWLKAFTIELPSLLEQMAIAGVLSDIDTEITALESRLTKARALKHAMAQALLTGRIRLVEPAE